MIIVIIAGGSGTRLWPLSTHDYPKHLLKLTNDRSLLQNTFDRAKRLSSDIFVITEKSHAHMVREQLPELEDEAFIVEPGRRGTINCILAALETVARFHDHDEPVAILCADHSIRDIDGFTESFKLAGVGSRESSAITLVGIEPTYPATGFGYIEKGDPISDDASIHKVKAFKEKPDLETAKKYQASGRFLWNSGNFVGSVNTFLNAMQKSAPQLAERFSTLHAIPDRESSDYQNAYLGFESDSIDFALIEKVKDLLVVPATFDWMDIGSFGDLHSTISHDASGNHMSGDGIYVNSVENAYIRNEEDKPVAVIGLDNVVVVNTPNGVLVSRKDLSQKVGDIAKQVQSKPSK